MDFVSPAHAGEIFPNASPDSLHKPMTIANMITRFIHRHRLMAKRLIGLTGQVLPSPMSRRLRAIAEQVAFRIRPEYQADTLPPVFHYWSGQYVSPNARQLGIHSPEQFYLDGIRAIAGSTSAPVCILSLGSGACTMELALGQQLQAAGVEFNFTCIDFNSALMEQARAAASVAGLGARMHFDALDCNRAGNLPSSDVIIVNQFFHHVEELESLCAALSRSLKPGGRLLSSDVIGRNGHLLWPSTESFVNSWWEGIPYSQRYDRYFSRVMERYVPVDHSLYSNEGIRAQDIVKSLNDAFDFEVFFTFGGGVMPFVERRIGFNFNPGEQDDRHLIDRIQEEDARNIASGLYPAVNMIASLRNKGEGGPCSYLPVSPAEHLATVEGQRSRV